MAAHTKARSACLTAPMLCSGTSAWGWWKDREPCHQQGDAVVELVTGSVGERDGGPRGAAAQSGG